MRGFSEFCRSRGWTPCLYSVTDDARRVTTELGWSSVQVAEETVLPLPGLVFTGKKWQDVRTALNKAAKVGITAEWITFSSAPLAITDQVRAISEEWVADKGMPEMGFTLGGLDELTDDEVRCLIAVDADRAVHRVTSWLPVYRGGRTVGGRLTSCAVGGRLPRRDRIPHRLGGAVLPRRGGGVPQPLRSPGATRPRRAARRAAAAAGLRRARWSRCISRCTWPIPTRSRYRTSATPSVAPTCRTSPPGRLPGSPANCSADPPSPADRQLRALTASER